MRLLGRLKMDMSLWVIPREIQGWIRLGLQCHGLQGS